MYEGSSSTIHSILQHQLVKFKITPCDGSSYFSLPKKLKHPMKGFNNIQRD